MEIKTKNRQKTIWSEFTKQYSLNKTLRFELKPVNRTAYFLKQNKIFEKDLTIDDSYNQAKFYFDKLHQKFVNEALLSDKVKEINLEEFAQNFFALREEVKKLKESQEREKTYTVENKINKLKNEYFKKIKLLLDRTANDWKEKYKERGLKFNKTDFKKNGTEFLMKSGVLKILKYEFPKEKEEEFKNNDWPSLLIEDKANPGNKVYIFDSFDNFTTYLLKFQETRKNLYKDDGTSTAIATRIISNFEKFLNNKKIFDEKYSTFWGKIGITKEEKEIFEVNYYYNCFIQKGIDKYNETIGQINRKSKEHRDKNKIDKSQLPLFKKLDKQILGEVIKERELITKTENETEEQCLIKRFKEFINQNKERIDKAKNLIKDLINSNFESEYAGIYLRRAAVNTIANRWFKNPTEFLLKLPQTSKSKENKESPKIKTFISLLDIKNALENFEGNKDSLGLIFKDRYYKNEQNENKPLEINNQESYWMQFLKIWNYEFSQLFEDKFNEKGVQIFWGYTENLEEQAERLNSFSRQKDEIQIIKNYCDASLKIYQMMKYFVLEVKNEKDVPVDYSTEFYNRFDEYYKDFEFIRYYNAIRNYVTQKPSNEHKIKLNFESGSLLTGFDKNKESEKLGIILRYRNSNKYFLGIIHKEHNKIFDSKNESKFIGDSDEDLYEKMELKLFPDPKKMIPKIVFANGNKKDFGWTQEIQDIKTEFKVFQENKKENKDIKFDKSKLAKLIEYYQNCLERAGYKKEFGFEWKKADEYQSMSEFNQDIEKKNYKIKFIPIKDSYIEEKVQSGELYLFEISNKDFVWPNQKKNIHTLYFLNLFSDKNIQKPIFRLGANAELFYRPKCERIVKEKRGKKEIIKYKRYTEDKILLHLPIEINYGCFKAPNTKQFNKKFLEFFNDHDDEINIIGIDRGEKNLLYYIVINRKGEILEHGSLNGINGVNYFEKLLEREKERLINRQSWEPVVKIKDLKKGYLSYVVRKIADLVEKYNAIIVLEDLNFRFKQIRGGIERTVYQQFEKQLIDKLSYLVFKDNRNPEEPGGILNGYQLVAPFTAFKDLGKQTGIIFYVSAEYTSKTDPLTGYRKNIYISNSASQKKIKDLINKLKDFGWDEKEHSYFFTYNQKDFDSSIDKEWTLFSKVPRVRREKDNKTGYWEYKPIDLNKEFKDLFEKYEINKESNDILSEIKSLIKNNEEILTQKKEFDGKSKNFYERFIYLFNLLLEARNTISFQVKLDTQGDELKLEEIDYGVDFFASPVKPFFTTSGIRFISKQNRDGKTEKEKKEEFTKENFPDFKNLFKECSPENFDSDGVGAYNIAKKGIILLERIKENPEKPDLYISKEDWDNFAIENALIK